MRKVSVLHACPCTAYVTMNVWMHVNDCECIYYMIFYACMYVLMYALSKRFNVCTCITCVCGCVSVCTCECVCVRENVHVHIYMCIICKLVMDVFCVLRDAGNSAPRNSCNYRASLVHLHSPSSKNCKILRGAFLGQNVCHASVMVCGHWHLGAWRLHIDQCVDTFLPTFHKSSGWMCEYVHNYIHRSRHLYLWCLIMFDPLMSYAS